MEKLQFRLCGLVLIAVLLGTAAAGLGACSARPAAGKRTLSWGNSVHIGFANSIKVLATYVGGKRSGAPRRSEATRQESFAVRRRIARPAIENAG